MAREPMAREPFGQPAQPVGRQQRGLGAVTDCHAPSVPAALREVAHRIDVHLAGGGADIEADVDVAVVLESELEDALMAAPTY